MIHPLPGRSPDPRAPALLLAFTCAVLGLSMAMPAAAQEAGPEPPVEEEAPPEPPPRSSEIEEIVVRGAESEAMKDFTAADSVTGFGAADLEALGAQDIADIASFTPNLEIVTGGATTPTFFIRGVGLNDFNANSTGAVAIYQDDVAINAPALQLSTLFDIEQVNVLRGPQGTGLARNASAGAIKIYSRKPSGDFGGYLRSDLGNYDSRDFEGAVEAPIYEDLLAARLAFRFNKRDGTMRNECGDATPFELRTPVPQSGPPADPNLRDLGKLRTDPPWSICGEPVFLNTDTTPNNVSTIPEGLEERVNDRDNWAARGTLLFQPTLDMTWLVNAHGSRRDELTRLGQSYGTLGFYCEDNDIDNCGLPGSGQNRAARIEGRLGAGQGATGFYIPWEVRNRFFELAPCARGVPAMDGMPGRPLGTCILSPEGRLTENRAKIQLAKELAEDLDSDPWRGAFNHTGPTTNDTWGGYLKGDIVLPGRMQLTTVTGYDTYDRLIDIDLDFSPETLFHIKTQDEGWQVFQDLRLEGSFDEEARLRWDLGGWYLREELTVNVQNDLGQSSVFAVGERDYTQDVYSAGGYVSLAADFGPFTLDGGVRYNWEKKKLDYSLITGSITEPFLTQLEDTWQSPTGLIRLTYRFREDTQVFVKYTHGWKPGTYNATSALREDFDTGEVSPDISVADPERIDAWETGVRGSWLDGRLGLDVAFFYYAYQDYQLFTAQQFSGGQPEFVILNADDAEVYGAEVDATLRPWIGSYFNVRFGWLESQFIDFVQLQQEIISPRGVQITVNRELQNSGNALLNSPQFKVSLTAEQTLSLGRYGALTGRYDGVWTDTTYFDATEGRGIPNVSNQQFLPEDTIAQRPYWLHNLRLSWRPASGRMELAAWVRNLTNQAYKTFAFDGSTFNNTTIYFVGDPRTWGGTLTINF